MTNASLNDSSYCAIINGVNTLPNNLHRDLKQRTAEHLIKLHDEGL